MDSTHVDRNRNNNSEMEDEFDNCTDELYDADNKQRNIHNYVTIKDENINDQTVVSFIKEETCDTKYKQGSIHNYVSIKDENIDEFITDCTEYKVYLNKTVSSGAYIKQEPSGINDEQSSIQGYLSIKDENLDDLTVNQETTLMTDGIDTKVCVYESIISGGYIKEEPCDKGNESGSIDNIIDMKGCIECGEECDLYCDKCPMLIRIFNSNNPDETDITVRQTLPKNFLDICETQSGLGVVALRAIPKGVVFGPFKGLDSTKHEEISKWKLKNKELVVIEDSEQINWMRYIRRADKSSHQNLIPIQYEDELYYRSESHINMGDELLVRWDSDKESEINDMEDSYWLPEVCESLDDSYACTFCCVGYKSISHLKAHNSTCIEKRNKEDFCKEIVQCDICKIYLDKKEYSDYHMDRCYQSDKKCVFNSRKKRNCGRPRHNGIRPFACTLCSYKAAKRSDLRVHIAVHNGDKPFACTLCPYRGTRKANLIQHMAIHNDDKPFACTLCPYKTAVKANLKLHVYIHNGDKPFACTLCPYTATTKSNLKQHTSVHNGEKPFGCTLCPYKSKRESYLKLHMSVHNDDKPFACTLCQYKATTKSNLKEHVKIHNNDKPFACAICPYKSTTKSNLKQHIKTHNNDKPFACTVCSYRTMYKSYLKKHIAGHNGDKP